MSQEPKRLDKELEEYRSLMEIPTSFDDGFSFSSLLGAIFLAMVMIPGSLYMELLAGMGIGPAAKWVTVILFIEVAKRANLKLSRAQIFVLFYMSGAIVGQNVHGTPLFRQFLVQSEAAITSGIATMFPNWVAPVYGSDAWKTRSFFQMAWLPAIGLLGFRMFFSKLDNAVLGYGLFRRTSDVEKLPFPMAPVGAQGIIALADDLEGKVDESSQWRWRVFSIGGALGMIFGFLYMGVPAITGAIFKTPLQIFPIPFVDLTPYTKEFSCMKAVAIGMTFNMGQFVMGMVLPFFAVLGSFVGAMIMVILNPILYRNQLLPSWESDMSTVETLFRNNIDFYFSVTIGLSIAVAVVGLSSLFRHVKAAKSAEAIKKDKERLKSRGDMPNWGILASYMFSTLSYILVSGYLINWHKGVMLVMVFFAYLYTPMISYVTARLEGMAGQMIEIPFIREIAFILSGYQGVAVWFLPIPKANYGIRTVFYKQAEMTGTKFTSIWKADAFLFPIILASMIGFSSFIWSLDDVPSPVYPFAQEIWQFEAKNACLIYSSTLGEFSEFQEALDGARVGIGFAFGIGMFGLLSMVNAPTMLFYGIVRGLSGLWFHIIITQFIGALIGKYHFQKKFGPVWRKYITVISAGFFCGSGLTAMFCIGIRFLMGATNPLPY